MNVAQAHCAHECLVEIRKHLSLVTKRGMQHFFAHYLKLYQAISARKGETSRQQSYSLLCLGKLI